MAQINPMRAALGDGGPFPCWSYDPWMDAGYIKLSPNLPIMQVQLSSSVILDMDTVNKVCGIEILLVSQFHPRGSLVLPMRLTQDVFLSDAILGCWDCIQNAAKEPFKLEPFANDPTINVSAVSGVADGATFPSLDLTGDGGPLETIDPPATDDLISDELDASLDEPEERPTITVEIWVIAEKNDGWYAVLAVVPGRTFYREMAQCLSSSDAETIVSALIYQESAAGLDGD